MRGHIIARKTGSFTLIFDLPREPDPDTGLTKRRQKWVTFQPAPNTTRREARKQAEAKLADLLGSANAGTFVEATKLTLTAWLRDWHAKAVKPLKRPATVRLYAHVIEKVAASSLGPVHLQRLRPTHLEAFYATLGQKPRSVAVYHAVLHRALKTAVRDRLLTHNPATTVEARPEVPKDREDVRKHCWTAVEARAFLATTGKAGSQIAAFYAVALETGARKGELHGLRWSDVDLEAGQLTIARQLEGTAAKPGFGPPKNGTARDVTISAEVVALLKAHKRAQAALKMANRTSYRDLGLVFAMEPANLQTPTATLGAPLSQGWLGGREFKRLTKAAAVRPIKFHGLRHTCDTLALGNGEPVHVVAQRLGHRNATMTLTVYAHALPNQQRQAADRLGAVLHG